MDITGYTSEPVTSHHPFPSWHGTTCGAWCYEAPISLTDIHTPHLYILEHAGTSLLKAPGMVPIHLKDHSSETAKQCDIKIGLSQVDDDHTRGHPSHPRYIRDATDPPTAMERSNTRTRTSLWDTARNMMTSVIIMHQGHILWHINLVMRTS